jgi:hypothetical protein
VTVQEAYVRARALMLQSAFGLCNDKNEREIAGLIVNCRKKLTPYPPGKTELTQIGELLARLALDGDRLPRFMKMVDTFGQATTRKHVLSAYVMVGVFLLQKRLPKVRELQEYIRFWIGPNRVPSERHIWEILKQLSLPRHPRGRPKKNRK